MNEKQSREASHGARVNLSGYDAVLTVLVHGLLATAEQDCGTEKWDAAPCSVI